MINHCDWCKDHLRQPGELQSLSLAPLIPDRGSRVRSPDADGWNQDLQSRVWL